MCLPEHYIVRFYIYIFLFPPVGCYMSFVGGSESNMMLFASGFFYFTVVKNYFPLLTGMYRLKLAPQKKNVFYHAGVHTEVHLKFWSARLLHQLFLDYKYAPSLASPRVSVCRANPSSSINWISFRKNEERARVNWSEAIRQSAIDECQFPYQLLIVLNGGDWPSSTNR